MYKIKENFTEIVFGLALFCVFVSKSLFNVFWIILALIGFSRFFKKKQIYKEKIFYWYLGLIPIGIVSNIMSSGIKGIGYFFASEKNLLIILIFILLNLELKQYNKLLLWFGSGALLAGFYSGISYFTDSFLGMKTMHLEYQNTKKMPSFQNVIKWSRLLQILNAINIGRIFLFEKLKRFFPLCIFIFFIWITLINGQRAGMISSIVSLSLFVMIYIFNERKSKIRDILIFLTLITVLSFTVYKSTGFFKDRLTSIVDVEKDISNRIRIGYWKIGMDMILENRGLGIGSYNSTEEFEKYIVKQPLEYQKKYYKYHEGLPFENSYINLALENGVIYLVYLLIMQIIILTKIFNAYLKENEKNRRIVFLSIFSLIIGDRIFIFFYTGSDIYVEFIITFLMFYAFKLKESEKINV